jgi:hypothetical protein
LAKLEQGLKTAIRQMTVAGFVHFLWLVIQKNFRVRIVFLKIHLRGKSQTQKAGPIILIAGSFSSPFLETGLV